MAEIKQESNILNQGVKGNDGLAIQQLIEQNLKEARFCFLAKITALNGAKVACVDISKRNDKAKNPILNNVLVAQPKSGAWKIQFNLKVGDIGLCVVNDTDLSLYKQSNSSDFIVSTDRGHDMNDAIFLPLSLNAQENTQELDFIISDNENQNFIKFKGGKLDIQSQDMATIKAQLVTIQSAQTTLKAVLQNLGNILSSAKTTTNNSHQHDSFDSGTKGAINGWKNSLNTLFEN